MDSLIEPETFNFMNCSIDVGRVRQMIEQGAILPDRKNVSIDAWARQVLALDRDQPDARPMSMLFHIDHDHVRAMPESRLEDPIFIAATRYGTLIFDGSHRVARAYLAGKDELPAFLFPEPLAQLIVQYSEAPPVRPAAPRRRR